MNELIRKLASLEIRSLLAICISMLAGGFVFALLFHVVPQENKDLVNILGGGLMGGLGAVISYYFGSSKKDKAE